MSFIYVGRLDEIKGIKVLFEAWRMMGSDAPRLVVCGTGPLENWCRKYVEEHNISSIDMRGKVDNLEAKLLMSKSEALIFPTLWYEGFPMTIVEAYSVGTPVIGSDIGNVGYLIIESVTGRKFEVGCAEKLIEAVKNKIDMRDKIKKYYNSNYGCEQNYNRLMEIYSIMGKL